MVRTESLGPGGYTPSSGSIPAPTPTVVGGEYSWKEILERQTKAYQNAMPTALDMYNTFTGTKPENGVYQIQKIAQKSNEQFLVNAYGPDDPRRPKPLEWKRTTELLLDMFGYGAAIASFIPNPATRIGGQLGANLSRAARAFNRGNVEGGIAALSGSARTLYSDVERYQRNKRYDKATNRK